MCHEFGRTYTNKTNGLCEQKNSPRCKMVPWMHPDEIYECCKCKISRTTEIDQCFVENRKKAEILAKSANVPATPLVSLLGKGEVKVTAIVMKSRVTCACSGSFSHMMFQYTTSTLWGVDKFDVESWVIKHAAAVLTIPEVKAMLTSAAVNQALLSLIAAKYSTTQR